MVDWLVSGSEQCSERGARVVKCSIKLALYLATDAMIDDIRFVSVQLNYDAGPARDLAGEKTTLCVVLGSNCAARVRHGSIGSVQLLLMHRLPFLNHLGIFYFIQSSVIKC